MSEPRYTAAEFVEWLRDEGAEIGLTDHLFPGGPVHLVDLTPDETLARFGAGRTEDET